MQNSAFTNKDNRYYQQEKNQIISLVSEGPNVILDLGCASGRIGRKLRQLNKAAELVGVEVYTVVAEEAARHYDVVHQGDIESLKLDYKEYFDYVICGDILEHLSNPWEVSKKIYGWLKNDGVFIATVPNVRYWRVLRDLLIFGKWEYVESGILDKTHLRFFTKSTFLKLLEEASFYNIKHEILTYGKKKKLFNKLTLSLFEEFMGAHIMTMSVKQMGRPRDVGEEKQ